MADGHESRGSMWDLTGSAGGTMWPVLADTHQVSLATQMASQMQLSFRVWRRNQGSNAVSSSKRVVAIARLS